MKNTNLILRRTHLYLGMLLIPWMLVFALSTFIFNRGPSFRERFGSRGQTWQPLFEKDYKIDLPSGQQNLRVVAQQILDEHGFDGPFGVSRQGQRLNINLPKFRDPKRLIYFGNQERLVAEEQKFTWMQLMIRMHVRHGYRPSEPLFNGWAFVVDLFCVGILVWIGTGLYLWWKIPGVRAWGWVAIGGGLGTFVAFVFSL